MAVVVPAMSRRRGRLSTAETWVVVGREAEAVGSARCGASRDEGDLAEEVGSFGEIVSIGSGIERKPILEQDLESADGGQDSELLQGGAVRLGHEGSGADTLRRCRAGQAIRECIGGDVNEQTVGP